MFRRLLRDAALSYQLSLTIGSAQAGIVASLIQRLDNTGLSHFLWGDGDVALTVTVASGATGEGEVRGVSYPPPLQMSGSACCDFGGARSDIG